MTEIELIETESQQLGLVNVCTLLPEVVNICTVVNKCAGLGRSGLPERNALASYKGKHRLKKIVHSRVFGATANIYKKPLGFFLQYTAYHKMSVYGSQFMITFTLTWGFALFMT